MGSKSSVSSDEKSSALAAEDSKFYDLTGWWNGRNNYISMSNGSGECTMGSRPTATITPKSHPNKYSFCFPDDETVEGTASDECTLHFSNKTSWYKTL